MTESERDKMVKENQIKEAKTLLEKMSKDQAILFCEEMAKRLPNINNTPPIHRESEDKYQQFWRFGVVSALNALLVGMEARRDFIPTYHGYESLPIKTL